LLGFYATTTSIKISNTCLSLHKQLIMSDNVRCVMHRLTINITCTALFAWNEIRKYSKKRNCNSTILKKYFSTEAIVSLFKQSSVHGCNKGQVCDMRVQFRFAYQGNSLIDVIIDLSKYVLELITLLNLFWLIKFISWIIER